MTTTLKALFGMGRPIILVGVLMVHVAGAAMAFAVGYAWSWAAFGWGFTALFLVGLSVNYVNEYADWETDALTEKTRYSGGSGVLPSGIVSRKLALQAGWATLIAGLLVAALGVLAGALTWTAVIVLALGGLGGWMYSLPPLKLAWNGGAEIANAVLGGLFLPLFGFVQQAGIVDWRVLPAFLPYALLIFTTAMATTWPDRVADAQVGKRTLATWMPVRNLRIVYAVVSAISFILIPFLVGWALHLYVALVSVVALPAVIVATYQYTRIRNPHPTARASMMLIQAQTFAWLWIGVVLTHA